MNYISKQFSKYLEQLRHEISLYKNEGSLWLLNGNISNTPANLALHLCGNLKYNIGTVIEKNGYKRNRELEFSAKGISRADILKEIDSTTDTVIPVLEKLIPEDYIKTFPDETQEMQTYIDALIRLSFHFSYHLGQINYHRRISET